MQTECTPKLFEFEAVERRSVVAGFNGGNMTSNASAAAGLVDQGVGLVRRFAACFIDRRDPRYVEHQVETLVGQRIFALALGHESLPLGRRRWTRGTSTIMTNCARTQHLRCWLAS